MEDMGLYDSDTAATLEPLKTVDVTDEQTEAEKAEMVFTKAKRGRIVQFRRDSLRIHYFLDEPSGHEMMTEDGPRFGFAPGRFHLLALHHAPE